MSGYEYHRNQRSAELLSRIAAIAAFSLHTVGTFAASPSDLWAAHSLGKCYPSMTAFLEHEFGPAYADDENIIQRREDRLAGVFYWAYDNTLSRNATMLLVRKEDDETACVVLYAPFADSIAMTPTAQRTLPATLSTQDAPTPGFPQTTIIYQLDTAKVYRPARCTQQRLHGTATRIPCVNAFANAGK